uniref:Uncharacterized protein n=1 Tax=Clastoptera arizonana TaxID=38151 RepID=A0A1B6DW97_9HEMI
MDIKEESLDPMDKCLIDIPFGNVSENLVVDPFEFVGIKLENEEWHTEPQSIPLIKHEAEVETNFDCDEIEIEEHFIKYEKDKSDIHGVPSVEEKADFHSLFLSTFEEDLIENVKDKRNTHGVPLVEEKADFHSLFFSTFEEDLIENVKDKRNTHGVPLVEEKADFHSLFFSTLRKT